MPAQAGTHASPRDKDPTAVLPVDTGVDPGLRREDEERRR